MLSVALPAAATHGEMVWLAINPVPLVGLVLAALLYARAVSVLAGRGRMVPRSQIACFACGIAMVTLATQTGIDVIGERDLVSVHMLQHLLIADLPGPLLLLGVRAPVLYFFWPRPILVTVARVRPLRSFWRWLRRPGPALSTWLGLLLAWHIPAAYEAALSSPAVHALEHICFALGGMLAWWPVLDPTHERVVGRVWKAIYVLVARTVGGILGTVMIAWPRPLYPGYAGGPEAWNISPLTDQQIAGSMMMTVDFVIVVVGVLWLLARSGETSPTPDDSHELAPPRIP